jgi:glyceraldehyde 3-phosphate dehydrogenase
MKDSGMKKARVAINGFGRIGRAFFKQALGHDAFEIVAINDLGDLENLAYLLNYDTVYGTSVDLARVEGGALIVGDTRVEFGSERDPAKLPWGDMQIDIVVEATGVFASYEKAKAHLAAGAKRVVVSAPVKDDAEAAGVRGATILVGVNEDRLATCDISSNASCTTNAASPLVAILKESIGIEKAILNTVHAYTATQEIVDGPNKKDFRKGRAAAENIVPTSTGAAVATTKVHADLAGKFDGIAMRVPVPIGSIVDVTFVAAKPTSVEAVNGALRSAAADPRWTGVFAVTDEPLVSSDIIGARYAAIADLSMTRVVGDDLVKVLSWYDNEAGYAHTLIRHVAATTDSR